MTLLNTRAIRKHATRPAQDRPHPQPGKHTLFLIMAGLLGMPAHAQQNYAEPGQIGDPASWETVEYKKDWGLIAIKASGAYALGYNGHHARVGVVDSGALLTTHPDLNGPRFHALRTTGTYASSGIRYPQADAKLNLGQGNYSAGQPFDLSGQWTKNLNDAHGTHVTGTVGANRDGNEMHGVAWGADVFIANTGATDHANYGPFQDYGVFHATWKALVDTGVQAINNSWGTNIRIVANGSKGADGGDNAIHLPLNSTAETEYEHFYFKKTYGTQPSFVDAAFDAVKGSGTVQVFTNGNRDMAHPYHRALYPYFRPEAEAHWIAVGALEGSTPDGSAQLDASGKLKVALFKTYNEAGNAKWWGIAAPARFVYSTFVDLGSGQPTYRISSGTSMAAPHVTGSLGVLLSRYPDMNGTQAREILFTTATNKAPDGAPLPGWLAADGTPDVRYGWGIPDLTAGMFGPRQFLGRFTYNMATMPLDVWTNAIGQQGLEARKREDLAWLGAYQTEGITAGGPYTLGSEFEVVDGNNDKTDHIIPLAEAEKWRTAYYALRAEAIRSKLSRGLYDGSLTKQGAGTLVLTGDNAYRGDTTVEGGTLYGFTESFGTGTVVVKGGQFGVLRRYEDALTKKGQLASQETRKANVEVHAGGTYALIAGHDVNIGTLRFHAGSRITVNLDEPTLRRILNDNASISVTLRADTLAGVRHAVLALQDEALTASSKVDGKQLTVTLRRKNSSTAASLATQRKS